MESQKPKFTDPFNLPRKLFMTLWRVAACRAEHCTIAFQLLLKCEKMKLMVSWFPCFPGQNMQRQILFSVSPTLCQRSGITSSKVWMIHSVALPAKWRRSTPPWKRKTWNFTWSWWGIAPILTFIVSCALHYGKPRSSIGVYLGVLREKRCNSR